MNVSEERALFSEHNGRNPIFLAHLMPLIGQLLNVFPVTRERESERELERGEGDRVERCFYATL